jgi:hypothetical protein
MKKEVGSFMASVNSIEYGTQALEVGLVFNTAVVFSSS